MLQRRSQAALEHLAGALTLVATAIVLTLVAGASGAKKGPFEPNDSRSAATDPLIDSKPYSAAIENLSDPDAQIAADVDYYAFELERRRTVKIDYSNLQESEGCFGPEARLLDAAGGTLATVQPPKDGTDRIRETLPAGRYYLWVRPYQIEPCEPPDLPYAFTATGLGRNPGFSVGADRLSRKKLKLRGKLDPGAPADRVRVKAWVKRRGVRRKLGFNGRAGAGGWKASAKLPRRLRGAKRARYRVIYRGDETYRYVDAGTATVRR